VDNFLKEKTMSLDTGHVFSTRKITKETQDFSLADICAELNITPTLVDKFIIHDNFPKPFTKKITLLERDKKTGERTLKAKGKKRWDIDLVTNWALSNKELLCNAQMTW
jgi:hypothetical protein